VGTEHLLLGLLRESDGIAAQVLMQHGVTIDAARRGVLNTVGRGVSGAYPVEAEPGTTDANLARLAQLWPSLPAALQLEILAMADAAGGR
jgi:ATP-dependent Clp protease ATP-binding subunit ClpC